MVDHQLPYTALIGWLVILVLLPACGARADTPNQATPDEVAPTIIPTRAPADERAKGDLNAPVTLIEYGDYQ